MTFKRQHEGSSLEHIDILEADTIREIAIPNFVIIYLDSVQQEELRSFLHIIGKISSESIVDIQKVNRLERAASKLTAFSYLGFNPLKDFPLQMKNRLFLHFIRLDYTDGSNYEYTSLAWPKEKDNSCFNNLPASDGPVIVADSFSNFNPLIMGTEIHSYENGEKAFLITASDKYYYVPYEYLLYSTRLYCQARQTILGEAISLLKSQKKDELTVFLDDYSKTRGGKSILGFSLEDSLRIRDSCDEVITIELLKDDAGFKLIQ